MALLPHVAAHRRIRGVTSGVLRPQAVINPLGGVSLLEPLAGIVGQPPIDSRLLRIELGGPRAIGVGGEKSVGCRYLWTVLRSTWTAVAIADADHPCAGKVLISRIGDIAIILGV